MRTISIILLCLCAVVVLAQDPLLAADKQQSLNTWTATNKKIGCVSSLPGTYGNAECLANFISDQMQVKATPNIALPATYRIGWDYVPPAKFYPSSTGAQLSQRADIYDSAMAAIFLLNEGHLLQAKKICDTLVLLVDNEPISDGRLRSAYSAASPIDRQNLQSHWASYASNPVDSSIDTEDQSFVILAFTRIYVHTGEYKYLKAAIKIASFIQKQLIGTSWSGYSAGFVYSNGKDENLDFRGIQHNIALYAAADMLYGITRDAQYVQIKDHASTFITNMFDSNVGIYRFSTKNNAEDAWNPTHVTSNAQSFVALSAVEPTVDRTNQALQYMINKLTVFDSAEDDVTKKTYRYQGVLFGEGGSGVNSESTAIAAMALQFQANRIQHTNPALSSSFHDAANHLVASLLQMQKYAPNSDGHGIVATTNQEGAVVWSGDEENGETWRYFPVLHTAASAWTGLAIAYVNNGDEFANPFSSYYKKSTNKFWGSSLLAGRAAEPEPLFDSSRPLNIVALISAILFGLVLIGGSVILCIANARIHRRNKELEVRKMSSPIKFSRLSSHTPVDSPASPGSPSGLSVDTSMGRAVYTSPATPGEQASFIHNQ